MERGIKERAEDQLEESRRPLAPRWMSGAPLPPVSSLRPLPFPSHLPLPLHLLTSLVERARRSQQSLYQVCPW